MTVLALGRLRLTFFPFTALWRAVNGGCRAEQRPCPLVLFARSALRWWCELSGREVLKDRELCVPVDAVQPNAFEALSELQSNLSSVSTRQFVDIQV